MTLSSFWGDRVGLFGIVLMPERWHLWEKYGWLNRSKDSDARVAERSRWRSGCLRCLGYSLTLAIFVLQQFSSLLSLYLCLSNKMQVGCLSTCVFVTVSNSSILQLQGCYYYVHKVLEKKERVILTSCASSHLSLFSSINRLLTDCTKFWKTQTQGFTRCHNLHFPFWSQEFTR